MPRGIRNSKPVSTGKPAVPNTQGDKKFKKEVDYAKSVVDQLAEIESKWADDPSMVQYIGGAQDNLRGVLEEEGYKYARCAENTRTQGKHRPNFARMQGDGWEVATQTNGDPADWPEQSFAIMRIPTEIWEYRRLKQQERTLRANGMLRSNKVEGEFTEENATYDYAGSRSGTSLLDLGISLDEQ